MSKAGNYKTYGDLPSLEAVKRPKDNFMRVELLQNMDHLKALVQQHQVLISMVSGEWCVPCQKLAPNYEQLAENMKDISQIKCVYENIDDENCCHKSIVTNVPTFLVYIDGKLSKTFVGEFDKLTELVNKILERYASTSKSQIFKTY